MFTGIIEELGTIGNIRQNNEAVVMTIEANKILKDVHLGDSIAVNGVCLTVTSYDTHRFTVDLMPETVRSTSLKNLQRGSKVNLERAMAANGRFGGHFVSGHVDGVGKIKKREAVDNAVYYQIEISPELRRYILFKGSIAVDGTSLTVFGVDETSFTVSIIPHTLSETVIGGKQPGDIVNIECDIVGKYIEQFITQRMPQQGTNHSLTESFLEEHGFK
ncbi:riboflavin synthase [Alkalihalobacillus sp. BA299]|uniref:riboflavin synthase n=1 Tax=Alkalihalobacillus sp. BA299 TaxID=2815938 RepID=UPI001ADA41C5|nr:riboflavin synthase [Alkalihalobacillus sp. BA299]